MTWDTVQALASLPVKVWGVAQAVVGVEERAQDSPVSVVGAGRVAGEVASDVESPGWSGSCSCFSLLAGLNLFVGMFNFIPLLPLDGGHIAGALFEGVRRGVARVRGRPDPGFVDVAKMLPIAYVHGRGAAGDERGADRRRHRRPDQPELTGATKPASGGISSRTT